MKNETITAFSSLQQANSFLRNKEWAKALDGYNKIWLRSPQMQNMIVWNMNHVLKHASDAAIPLDIRNTALTLMQQNGGAKDTEVDSTLSNSISVQDLFDEVAEKADKQFLVYSGPLVSVIVTANNVEDYIEECIRSLREQTYQNIEIIVVDDASTDRTVEVVSRVANSQAKVNLLRLNTNLGTYFAKNYGLTVARGEFVFFQDGDDFSHPDRIALSMGRLLHTGKDVVRGAYARFRPETNRIVTVNGLVSKLGLITLGVRRKIFSELGFFNNTTKASDDEFFERIRKFKGQNAIVSEPLPLYFATFRENSLFSDMVANATEGALTQKPSSVRADYVKEFKKIHDTCSEQSISKFFQFPALRDRILVAAELTKLINVQKRVIANVCSFPAREKSFQATVASIINQCDHLNIYLDRYEDTPSFLKAFKNKITIYSSRDLPGLRDNGKFIALESLIAKGEDAYYLTIDDDIIYPPDYVTHLIRVIDQYDGRVVAGVHGVRLKEQPKGYFSDSRWVYGFERALEKNRLVNVLGTGTLCFRTSAIKHFRLESMPKAGMADLYFAVIAKENFLPMVCVSRHSKWLVEMDTSNGQSLFQEFATKDDMQGELIRQHSPWGNKAIIQAMNHLSKDLFLSLNEVLPKISIVN